MALRRMAADQIAALKLALDLRHTDRQQAFTLLKQYPNSTFIQRDETAGLQLIGKPLLASCNRCKFRHKAGAQRFTCRKPRQNLMLSSTGNHGGRTAACGALCRSDLGGHAALSEPRSRAARHCLKG